MNDNSLKALLAATEVLSLIEHIPSSMAIPIEGVSDELQMKIALNASVCSGAAEAVGMLVSCKVMVDGLADEDLRAKIAPTSAEANCLLEFGLATADRALRTLEDVNNLAGFMQSDVWPAIDSGLDYDGVTKMLADFKGNAPTLKVLN